MRYFSFFILAGLLLLSFQPVAADSSAVRLEFAKIRAALTEIQKSLEVLEKQFLAEQGQTIPAEVLPSRGLSLGELFILDRLFRSRFLNPDRTTLGDLLILEKLFNPQR